MALAAACVVVAVGKGRRYIRQRYDIPESQQLTTIEIAGKSRLIAFLPHPTGGWERGPRTFHGLYSSQDLQALRDAVAAQHCD
jgi:hypothetical protein